MYIYQFFLLLTNEQMYSIIYIEIINHANDIETLKNNMSTIHNIYNLK